MLKLLTSVEVAERLRVSIHTIYRWRGDGVGPPHLQIMGSPRYSSDALEKWLNAQAVKPWDKAQRGAGGSVLDDSTEGRGTDAD